MISRLAEPAGRPAAALQLGLHLRARDLIIFIEDAEVGRLLPAPGFPQTLQRGRAWRALLAECTSRGRATAELPAPASGATERVTALAGEDGSVLALVGGEPEPGAAADVVVLLPLLAAALRGERAAQVAAGQTRAARQAAEQSRVLAEKLDTTRTELERALRAAEAASRSKDHFLATVSHELRTPLTPILGFARMLRSGQLDAAGTDRGLASIERNAEAQARLIEDLLDFSGIIAGKLRLEVEPVDPAAVIEAALDVVRPAAEARGVRLQAVLDSHAGPVSGDAGRLRQVFWNLLTNAVKFTPKGGRVQVRLERINSHVRITVSDTGCGISPEFLPYVFERFRQADMSSTRTHGGLGLGLSIVRQLVEMHGGAVRASSGGEDQGATFTVTLPQMIVHEPAAPREDVPGRRPDAGDRPPPLSCPPELDGLRVLVVDDEADSREMLAVLMRSCGSDVTTASSAAEALDAVLRLRPDLLISDIEMPDEDGYALIGKVRALGPEEGGQTPAVALTAHARLEDRLRALSAGYHMHLSKPVEPAELVVVIASLAGRRGKRPG